MNVCRVAIIAGAPGTVILKGTVPPDQSGVSGTQMRNIKESRRTVVTAMTSSASG